MKSIIENILPFFNIAFFISLVFFYVLIFDLRMGLDREAIMWGLPVSIACLVVLASSSKPLNPRLTSSNVTDTE